MILENHFGYLARSSVFMPIIFPQQGYQTFEKVLLYNLKNVDLQGKRANFGLKCL